MKVLLILFFHDIMHMQPHLFLQAISIHFCRFNHEIYHSLIISNLFHFSWLAKLILITCGSACPQVSVFLVYLLGICNDKSKHCLLFHWSFSGYIIWFDFLYFALGKIWTGDIGKIWIPTTVQILPAPAVQMLPLPQKIVKSQILRHEDLCRKADINKIHKTTSLIKSPRRNPKPMIKE